MEQELAEERVAAEAEAKRAQEAIQAKQQELQQIEQQRQHEVCSRKFCWHCVSHYISLWQSHPPNCLAVVVATNLLM